MLEDEVQKLKQTATTTELKSGEVQAPGYSAGGQWRPCGIEGEDATETEGSLECLPLTGGHTESGD